MTRSILLIICLAAGPAFATGELEAAAAQDEQKATSEAAPVVQISEEQDAMPEAAPVATISGDVERGRDTFVTCSSCHGTDGQGIWSQKAPRLSGANDWYLVRQLENYRRGIRGSHPQDLYGKQMTLISVMLRNEQAIRDLVAYINTLGRDGVARSGVARATPDSQSRPEAGAGE